HTLPNSPKQGIGFKTPKSRNDSVPFIPANAVTCLGWYVQTNAERQKAFRDRRRGGPPGPGGRPRKSCFELWESGTWKHMSKRNQAIRHFDEAKANQPHT